MCGPPPGSPQFPAPPVRAVRLLPGVMGRLKPGLSLAQAQAQLDDLAAQLTRQFPDEYPVAAGWSIRLVPVQQDLVREVRTELPLLFAGVAFLRESCQFTSRARHERRLRLITQLLTESILLATISG